VREKIAKVIGQVTVPNKTSTWHSVIERLLKENEKRREKQLHDPHPFLWDKPIFDSRFERRRLRLLNSLFYATAKLNGKPWIHGKEGREIQIVFSQQRVGIRLDRPKRAKRGISVSAVSSGKEDTSLCLAILEYPNSEKTQMSWEDRKRRLEQQMTEIALEVVLTAEKGYRESAVRHYLWRVERKAELEEEQRQRKIEAERTERERLKRMEQEQVERLLGDAAAFRQAIDIRTYVEAIRCAIDETTRCSEEFERWAKWALAVAERTDPSRHNRFLASMRGEGSDKKE
jgi:hypothetical protein